MKNIKDRELFEAYQSSKTETEKVIIRNKLIQKNQALVSFIIQKYYSKPTFMKLYDDLFQEGIIGLMTAIDRFDLSKDCKFSTYASWWIRQAVNNYLLNIEPEIHIPSHIRAAQSKLHKLSNINNTTDPLKIDELISEHNNKEIRFSEKMIKSIKCAYRAKFLDSVDTPHTTDNGSVYTLRDLLPDTDSENEAKLDRKQIISAFKDAIKNLPERKRNVLLLRFDVINEEEVLNGRE